MRFRTSMRWMACWAVFWASAVAFGAPAAKDLVHAKLVADAKDVKAGEAFHVGLVLKIKEGWHIYWKNPGDSGAPTTATLKAPDGFKVEDWQFPVPEKIADPGGTIYGYTDEVMLVATVTPPTGFQAGAPVEFSCDATWLVCEKVCLMGKGSAKVSLPATDDNQEIFAKWMPRLPSPAGDRANVSVKSSGEGTNQKWSGVIKLKVPAGVQKAEWFPGPSESVVVKNVNVKVEGDTVEVSFSADRIGDVKSAAGVMDSVVAYTVADGSRLGVTVPVPFENQSASAR
jgi:DsbC/DsbD-like thiol-disulfide interchange protein